VHLFSFCKLLAMYVLEALMILMIPILENTELPILYDAVVLK